MRDEFLPFCRPHISEAEIEAVAEVLRSGWITTGPKAAEFELAFATTCGAQAAVAVVSGTAGMHVILEALDIGPGAGHLGGEIVAQGTPDQIRNNPASVTGKFLTGR